MSNELDKRTLAPSAVALSLSINPSKTMTISAVPVERKTTLTDSVESAIVDCFVSSATGTTFQQ